MGESEPAVTQFEIPTERSEQGESSLTLRPYQEEAKQAILDALERGVQRPLLMLPTGTGKTIVFSSVAKALGYPVLVIAHRDELLDQAADKFRQIDHGVSIGKVKAGKNQWGTEVVVASIQTLSRHSRLSQIPPNRFRLVIVDEAHHAPADTYTKVIAYFANADVPILGVTATPERGDGSGLDGIFQELVYQRDIMWGIENGYLADLRGVQVKLRADLGRIKKSRGDFQAEASSRMLHDAGAPEYALKAWHEHATGRKGIIFTPTVHLAHEMAATFRAGGVAAEAVDGGTAEGERKAILGRLHSGETRVVANAAVLGEGYDEPSVDCIVVARPTLSRPLFVQMVGRGTRTFPGKQDCLVLDLVGVTENLALVTLANLFGKSTRMRKELGEGQPVTRAHAAEYEREQEKLELAEQEAARIDLFTQRKFNWIRAGHRLVLSVGDGFVVLAQENAEKWGVVHEPRTGDPKILATELDLGYAQGVAEDFVRQEGASVLNAKNAGWRTALASPAQVKALQKWGIPIRIVERDGRQVPHLYQTSGDLVDPEPLSKGRASDLLTERIAAAKGRRAA